ncbi:hypothetical protein EYF80_058596 [Liparis tanakae]|uniref:Uncharacterized protein n=1 Tax=Liparis tanakae TaxID=230148 RepID=A0A4Z2ESJ5_9TELE|nr:hypothetical protein EYF80_058596 [Liparis tanakae]
MWPTGPANRRTPPRSAARADRRLVVSEAGARAAGQVFAGLVLAVAEGAMRETAPRPSRSVVKWETGEKRSRPKELRAAERLLSGRRRLELDVNV